MDRPVVDRRERWGVLLARGCEGVVLLLICLAPWAFGAVHLYFEFWLVVGVAVVLGLWAMRVLVLGQFTWQRCPVALCLAGLFLLAVVQILPLPLGLLGILAPGAQREALFPEQPEELPDGAAWQPTTLSARDTISATPGATRSGALRLLAVLLLFAAVRNCGAFPGGLQRLAIATTLNGALLAAFALLQFFGAPPHQVYGVPSQGTVYGPFLCRNHYPFYVNLCFGLGLGLLLSLAAQSHKRRSDGTGWRAQLSLLQHPRLLWVCAALALMAGSVVVSLSRGGALALLAGGLVCLLVSARSWRGTLQPSLILLLIGLGLGVAWFAGERVEARFASLGDEDASMMARLATWQRVLPLALASPWLGTGLGTFGLAEPLHRAPGEAPSDLWDHAHNDYVEALIEGGLVRLILSLLAIFFVFRLGIRGYRRCQGKPEGGLVLGCLLGFTAVVAPSGVDFGLHVPAVAVLTSTVAAYLCMAGSDAADSWRVGRLGSLAGAVLLVLLSVVLVRDIHREEQAERLRLTAARLDVRPGTPAWDRRLELLEAAVAWTPENAVLRQELAEAYFAQHKAGQDQASAIKALVHYLQAREGSPLLPVPHLRLAALRDRLESADPCSSYLARAKQLRPADTEIWYIAGIEELQRGADADAWHSWRQALRCSDRHLRDIVERSTARLAPADQAALVLPDDPKQLAEAAVLRFPRPADAAQRQVYLEKALTLLAAPRDGAGWQLRARIHSQAGQPQEALAAYQSALSLEPRRTDWRFERAELLVQQGRLDQARAELTTLLDQDPSHAKARDLLARVNRQAP